MRPRVPIEERFWQFVPGRDGSGCWLWVGTCDSQRGHPLITAGGRHGKKLRARRVAFEIQNGPIPEGHEVIQICGQIRCMRGSHLQALTHSEVMVAIMRRDGTWAPSGEDHFRAKLNSRQVAQLRHLAVRGAKVKDLVQISGMSAPGVRAILAGKSRVSG
jgi:HNH endonuclease